MLRLLGTATLLTAIITGSSDAATISYVGTQANIDTKADDGTTSGWHSTGNAKPLDIDGDNALGTDGWIIPTNGSSGANNPPRSLPSFITDTNGVGWDVLVGNAARKTDLGLMDGPTSALPGVNPISEVGFSSWFVFTGPPNGVEQDIIQFTFNSSVNSLAGQTLRLGLLFDAVDSTVESRRSGDHVFTITQTSGGSATASSSVLAFSEDGLDAAFFDLNDLSDGDTIVISADPSSGTYAHLSGVTFDTAVPEPGSLALLGLGGLLIAGRRRRG